MRFARTAVLGLGLLVLAHDAGGSSRASASAGASVIIIDAAAAAIDLPESVVISRTGRHKLAVHRTVNGAPPAAPALSVIAATTDLRVRLLDERSGAVLEIDVATMPVENVALPLQVTYHQY